MRGSRPGIQGGVGQFDRGDKTAGSGGWSMNGSGKHMKNRTRTVRLELDSDRRVEDLVRVAKEGKLDDLAVLWVAAHPRAGNTTNKEDFAFVGATNRPQTRARSYLFRRGTPGWGLDYVRSQVLPSFIRDLERASTERLPRPTFEGIKSTASSLSRLANLEERPALRQLGSQIKRISSDLEAWISANPSASHEIFGRVRVCKLMRHSRDQLAASIRGNHGAWASTSIGRTLKC